MRILYLARFGQRHSNQDEEAIAWALADLGHEVIRVDEPASRGRRHANPAAYVRTRADFILFHHYGDWAQLSRFPHPKVFWLFDLVHWPDPALAGRNAARAAWLQRATEVCAVGFCTDGDAVARDTSGKLVWLPQGADGRLCAAGSSRGTAADVLFTGIGRGGGLAREQFVHAMRARYAHNFLHVERGIHGRPLADLVAACPLAVAPPAPVTDRYCSNRVFLLSGFGACLLHPKCEYLRGCYEDGREIVYYDGMDDLHARVAHLLSRPEERSRIAAAALARTLAEHTYRHRVERLIAAVKGRLPC